MQSGSTRKLATLLAAALGGAIIQTAAAQSSQPDDPPTPRRSSSGGLIGVPAALPNVLGRDRSLPIDRHITLPGLPTTAPNTVPAGVFPVPGVVVGGRSYYTRDDGLTVRGSYADDKWRLQFHLGGPTLLPTDPPRYYYPVPGWSSDSRYWQYRYGTYMRTGPIDGYYTQSPDRSLRYPQLTQPPAAAPAEPARELTDLERATLLMAYDELDRAIDAYRDHLEHDSEDVKAMRALGIALMENNRTEDGLAMISLAYRTDPMLARSPLGMPELGLDGRRYDTLLAQALQYARRTDAGAAHLAAVVLLQADGKLQGAARVLDRAEKAGLEAEVAEAFRREIGSPAGG